MTDLDPNITKAIAQLALGGVAALAGGWWGARSAVAKLRRERAFERQLQWHEDMADNLYRLASAMNQAAHLGRTFAHPPARLAALDAVNTEVDRLAILGQKADMYARRRTLRLVNEVMTKMRDAAKPISQPASGVPASHDEHLAMLGSLVEPVKRAGRAVADDVRMQLGLGELRPRGWRRLLAGK